MKRIFVVLVVALILAGCALAPATVPGTRRVVESYQCTLQIEVNGQGTIIAAGLAGKMGACAYFRP